MKKFCKVFLCTILFASVFALVSCGNVSSSSAATQGSLSSSGSSVKFTLPSKNARAASAGSIDDVDYYNVYINDENFENALPGTPISSKPIAVGTEVTITVEAFGKAKDGSLVVKENSRVAYYTTTLSMPSSPVSLNIKMSEYKTEYYKVSLDMDGFDNRITSPTYVASSESYTLRDFGIVVPTGGTSNKPNKHTGWLIRIPGVDDPPSYSIGESIPITSDTTFTVQYVTGRDVSFSAITQTDTLVDLEVDDSFYSVGSTYYVFPGFQFTLPHAKKEDQNGSRTDVTQWEWYDDGTQQTGAPGEKVLATENSYGSGYTIQTW